MGMAAAAAFGVGTGIKALGEVKEGRDAEAVAKYNADVAMLEGSAAAQQAASQEQIARGQTRAALSRMRLLAAANGMSVGGGSVEDVQVDSARAAELNAMAIRMGGQLARQRATAQAQLLREQGHQARAAGLLAGLTTALTGGAVAYDFTGRGGKTAAG